MDSARFKSFLLLQTERQIVHMMTTKVETGLNVIYQQNIWLRCILRKQIFLFVSCVACKKKEFLGFWTLSIVRYLKNTRRFGNWICFRPQV
jgi:hypothetical protein